MRQVLFLYLLAVNLATMILFGLDKRLAVRGKRRISEATLLCLAWIGGTPGGWTAMGLFRHKTRKTAFKTRMILATLLQTAGLLAWQLRSS